MKQLIKGFKKPAIFTMVAGLLFVTSACGSSGSESSSSTSPDATMAASAAPSASTAPAKKVEITAWDKPAADDPAKAFKEKSFADFDAKYPNIKVTHVEQTKQKEREQFMTAVAGGEQPDVYKVAFPDMESYIKQGIPADITELWNKSADKNNFIPSSLNAGTKDGKVYGIPNDMYVTGMIFNKKLFKDVGLDPMKPPATWDEFVTYAQKLKDPNKSIIGYDILGMDWADWFFEYYVWQAGGDLTKKNEDGSVELTFTSDPAVQALQFYQDLKWKYKVTQKNVVQSLDDNQKDFYTYHSGMQIAGSDWFGGFISKGMKIEDIGFAPLPAGPSGKSPSQVGGSYLILNPKASKEKQEAAFTYASFFTSKAYNEALLQYNKDTGSFPNLLNVRKDVDVTQYVTGVPADLVAGIQNAAKDTHLEYALKGPLSPYIVKAVQKVLLTEKADPKAEMQAAQDLAQKEIVDKYNADLKK